MSNLYLKRSRRRAFQPAMLECENRPSCGKWVKHHFVELRDGDPSTVNHIYACDGCGAERVWGNEEK